MSTHNYIAVDLGASSGRVMIGTLKNGILDIREMHRFPSRAVSLNGHDHWDYEQLFTDIKEGLTACANDNAQPESIGIDTWGVDYAMLSSDGSFLGMPYHYRDKRNEPAMEEFPTIVPRERIYELTGIQFMPFNTLFQFYAMVREKLPELEKCSDILFMPDIFNYLLSGIKKTDFSFATTTQLYNPNTKGWEPELFEKLGISMSIMQDIVQPGTVIGEMQDDVCNETGLNKLKIVAVAGHDTGSAVAAIPAKGKDWAYISSGTWSLMGVELPEPSISLETLKCGFTNEGGVDGTIRFLKNIMGMWLIQGCKKEWDVEHNYSYPEIDAMAETAEPFKCLIDPDSLEFYNPNSMTQTIADFCTRTNQPVPADHGDYTRCIYESLALKYRQVLENLREVQPQEINKLHIIGGGVQNELLCQYAANATGLPVIAGPVEATAIGNILVQAMALGHIKDLKELRDVVRNSCKPKIYQPENPDTWNAAYERFLSLQ